MAANETKATALTDQIERRFFSTEEAGLIEARKDKDTPPQIAGYAALYGKPTNLGWFIESIKRSAFDEVLKTSDARCLKNHDPNLLLGRESSGTLRLESNSVGLKFQNDMPETNIGRDTYEEIRRGDLAGCSFAFIVAEDEWRHFDDGRPSERTITKIRELFDVGPVTYPAYPDTSVAARSLEAFKKQAAPASPQSAPADKPESIATRAVPAPVEPNPQSAHPEGARPGICNPQSPAARRKTEDDYNEMGRILNACRQSDD